MPLSPEFQTNKDRVAASLTAHFGTNVEVHIHPGKIVLLTVGNQVEHVIAKLSELFHEVISGINVMYDQSIDRTKASFKLVGE